MRLIAILLACTVGFGAALYSRFGGLLFYLWFAIFRPQEWSWVPIASARLSLISGLLLIVPCVLTGVLPAISHGLSIAAVAFWLCALLAQPNAVRPDLGWYWLDLLGKSILISLFLVRLTSTRKQLLAVVMVIAGSFGFFSAKAGLVSLLGGGLRFYDGQEGAFSDNNAYAVGCVMIMPLLWVIAQNARYRVVRWMALSAVPLSALTVISTFSRAGFLALVASTFVYIILQRRRLLAGAFVTILVLGALAFVPLPTGYTERIQTIQTYDEDKERSALSRLHIWAVGLKVAVDRPFGIGLWNFESVYDLYDHSAGEYGRRRAAHNSHLQAIVEAGWIGAVVWCFLLGYAFVIAFRVKRRAVILAESGAFFKTMANAFIVSHVGFIVGGTFVSMAYNDVTWFTFAMVVALDKLSRAEVPAGDPVRVNHVTSPFWRMPVATAVK